MQLFKGYVETKDKKCIEKFKGRTDFKNYDQIKLLPEFAGILGDETILIDIDEFEASEIMFKIVKDLKLQCRVYKTTRGKHFLFKNNGSLTMNRTHASLAICLKSDIKLGCKNSYSVLKFKDTERPILYDVAEDHIQDLPKWIMPIKTTMDFLDMDAGDGRNQALFNYILTLQSSDFTVEEARETIRIINKYVLKEPLSDSEIEVILRDDAFQKPIFFKGATFLFDKFATYIKNNRHIIKINNQLHLYKNGIYISGQAELESEMIKHIPNLNKAKRNEVLSYLDILIRENTTSSDANMIAFKNGIYNLTDDSFVDFSPEYVITNKINWNYSPEAHADLADNTLNKIACQDQHIRMLLEEVIGYSFYRRNELGKAFILTGDKSNGKSTFLDMVKTLLGEENITALDLKELGDRFKTAELFGKLANIGDDIGDEFIANAAVFKKLVTGDRMNVERKGQNPFDFNNFSKMLFSANNIPRIKDKTGAVLRRLVIIPFDAKFSKDDPDYKPFIKYELRGQESMEYLVIMGIQGLKRVLQNREFTISTKVEAEIQEYEESNNPIISFVKEIGEDSIENEPTNQIYKRYHEYCLSNSLQALSNIEFSKQMNKRFGLTVADKKIEGKKYRIFIRKNEKIEDTR
jgi:putative DNA primase/helicase